MVDSDKTKELRKKLEASIEEDEANKYKSSKILTPIEFYNRWCVDIDSTNINQKQHNTILAGFRHDLEKMVTRVMERINLGHKVDDIWQ